MRGGLKALVLLCTAASFLYAETIPLPLADGFDLPVGRDGKVVYHKARGFQPNGHLGEDWDGPNGGDTDLGDPVYASAAGLVLFARDYHLGWGNVVIIRHAYLESGETKFVDSLYGHLNEILTAEGALVQRGQKIATIGNNHGMYEAHLHFEMRKNLAIGMNRSAFPRDFSCYFDPTTFVEQHRALERGGELVQVPVKTFDTTAPPLPQPPAIAAPPAYAGPLTAPVQTVPRGFGVPARTTMPAAGNPRGPFIVDRYSDMRGPTPAPLRK